MAFVLFEVAFECIHVSFRVEEIFDLPPGMAWLYWLGIFFSLLLAALAARQFRDWKVPLWGNPGWGWWPVIIMIGGLPLSMTLLCLGRKTVEQQGYSSFSAALWELIIGMAILLWGLFSDARHRTLDEKNG